MSKKPFKNKRSWSLSLIAVALCSFVILFSFKNLPKDPPINEVPHLFYTEKGVMVKWIENGVLKQEALKKGNAASFEKKFNLIGLKEVLKGAKVSFKSNADRQNFIQEYEGVNKFIAVSDLHGQHDVFVSLLQKHSVIDKSLNWSYGKGHLVIVGDIVDRGDKVTEALWLVYKLEQQAAKAGGKLHYVIGNHELMIFDNDLRYINKKYAEVATILGTTGYDQLFSDNTVIGRWLRSKPVIISINEALFTHGGISNTFVSRGFTPESANELFADSIFTQEKEVYRKSSDLNFLSRTEGPLWYRGYFTNEEFTTDSIANILNRLGKKRIIVGHTSHPTIVSKFDHQVFGVDASMKNGKNGELLVFENGKYYRGLLSGERIEMN